MHICNENCNFIVHTPKDSGTPTINRMLTVELDTDNETSTVEMVTDSINTGMH